MTPHELEAVRFKLLSLFQVEVKPSVNMLGTDNTPAVRNPGSKALIPDNYSTGLLMDIKNLLFYPWLLFAYHPETRQCPDELALCLLVKAIPDLDKFQPSKRQRLANLAVIAAMDIRQEALGGEKCTVQMICDLAGVYVHNWQRDYREHFSALKQAAKQIDTDALTAAAKLFNRPLPSKAHFTACNLDGSN